MPYETINTVLQSTCVVVVFAYLLTRGPILALLEQRRSARANLFLGLFFGLAGLVELFFVKSRFPYDTYTLIVTYAVLRGGAAAGTITALLVALGAPLFLHAEVLGRAVLSVLASLGFGLIGRGLLRSFSGTRVTTHLVNAVGVGAVSLAEAASIGGRFLLNGTDPVPFSLPLAVVKICANSFGIVLLQMIMNDALGQRIGERYQMEVERGRTMLAEARLGALRARIHPHFLFNALTSIAGLCRVAPEKAEAATVQLGQIMRRALESGTARRALPLGEETEYVTDYLELEKLRLSTRLRVVWDVAPELQMLPVPPFVLQTLVENAVQHGISPKLEPGTVRITARVSARARDRFAIIAIMDDGVGMSREEVWRALHPDVTDRAHGLSIASEQLCLLYGERSRLRVFSCPDRGTIVAFRIPFLALPVAPSARSRQEAVFATGTGAGAHATATPPPQSQ